MKLFRSILSVVFAMLVFFSSTSFTIGIHFCSGKVQNMTLFGKADPCEKEKNLPPCHRHKKSSCCDDETIVHESEGFKNPINQINVTPSPAVHIELPMVVISEIIPSVAISRTKYQNYDTPLRSSDRTVTHQVFII